MGPPSRESIVMPKGKNTSSISDNPDALEAFGEKVRAAQKAHDPQIDEEATGWAVGVRYASEFSAAVIVGAGLGFGIDHFANTTPWVMLVGLILGFMAGTRNIVRLAKEMSVDESES